MSFFNFSQPTLLLRKVPTDRIALSAVYYYCFRIASNTEIHHNVLVALSDPPPFSPGGIVGI